MTAAMILIAGASLDVLIGDPKSLPHPVRGIGWLAARSEEVWRSTRLPLRAAGILFTLTVAGMCAAVVHFTSPWAAVFWVWGFLAIRSLASEAENTVRLLDDLPAARRQLSTIVGRDTEALDEAGIVRAVIETVSENFSDAVVAPLFWFVIGGPAAMAVHKAVNTLDSMVGYRNGRYREFGWASARLDDAMNWIPARISVLIVAAASCSWRAVQIAWRDGNSQPSPNSGYPEAAFAGALGVQLGGVSTYRGVASHKPTLGDPHQPLTRDSWPPSRQLFGKAAAVAVLLAVVALWR